MLSLWKEDNKLLGTKLNKRHTSRVKEHRDCLWQHYLLKHNVSVNSSLPQNIITQSRATTKWTFNKNDLTIHHWSVHSLVYNLSSSLEMAIKMSLFLTETITKLRWTKMRICSNNQADRTEDDLRSEHLWIKIHSPRFHSALKALIKKMRSVLSPL